MRIHLGSLVAGGLLVAGGFALALVPSWLRPVEAGSAFSGISPQVLVTSDDSRPSSLYTWTMSGGQVTAVTQHIEQQDGVIVSRELKLITAPRVR